MVLSAWILSPWLLVGCPPAAIDPCANGNICTVMGTGQMGYNGGGNDALDTWLYLPTTVEIAPDGAVLVVDFNNNVLRELRDGLAVTVAGNGFHEYAIPGANALASPLENPIDARYGPDGMLYILSPHESRLIRVDDAGIIEVVAGTGDEGYTGDGGDALLATFGQPCGFDIDTEGAIWIADTLNGSLRRVAPGGGVSTVLTGLGLPQRVRVQDGGVYVTDTVAGTIVYYDPERGTSDTVVDGLSTPWGFEIGPGGQFYVADSGASQVVRVDSDTREIIAGTGEAGFSGDEGPATEAQLAWPSDVAFGPDGELYISDMQNARVRRVLGVGP